MYVYANYSNGDAHKVDASELSVAVGAPDKLSYAIEGGRHRDALAGSSCTEPLLRVSLAKCNASEVDAAR